MDGKDDESGLAQLIGFLDSDDESEAPLYAQSSDRRRGDDGTVGVSRKTIREGAAAICHAAHEATKRSRMDGRDSTSNRHPSYPLNSTVDQITVPLRSANTDTIRLQSRLLHMFSDQDQTSTSILGIKVADRLMSEDRVREEIFGLHRPVLRFDKLFCISEDDDDKAFLRYATSCVLTCVGPTEISVKTKLPYRKWILSDLNGRDLVANLYADAFREVSKSHALGSVLVLIDARISITSHLDLEGHRRTHRTLIINKPDQVTRIGRHPGFAKCQISNCDQKCDKTVSVYCADHAREQLRIVSVNRMSLNSSGGAMSLDCMNSLKNLNGFAETTRDARRIIRGLRQSDDGDDVQVHFSPKEITEKDVKGVDGKSYMTSLIQEKKGILSDAEKKVATALRLLSDSGNRATPLIPANSHNPLSMNQQIGDLQRKKSSVSRLALLSSTVRMDLAGSVESSRITQKDDNKQLGPRSNVKTLAKGSFA